MEQTVAQRKANYFSIENLKLFAQQRTGLKDWGGENFNSPLQKLIDAFQEAYPGDVQRQQVFAYSLVDVLSRQLYIQNNLKSHPEIADIPVEKPIFITGLPRTGTTLTHNLISQDSQWRVLQYYELVYPFVIPGVDHYDDYTIQLAEQGLQRIYQYFPQLKVRHETKVTAPEECYHLKRNTFYCISWANETYSPTYMEWFLQQDMTEAYRYYKKQLQLLLWRRPGKELLLKCPSHLYHVDSIFKVFPQARVIWLHRNPVKSIASGLSLLSLFHTQNNGKNNPFLDLYLKYYQQALHQATEIERSGDPRLLSVSYKRMVDSPIDEIHRIYDKLNLTWNPENENNIRKWLEKNPQHKHGVHRYNIEDFGLTETRIKTEFAAYYKEYGHLL